MHANAVIVVIEERQHGNTQRHNRLAGRRYNAGNQADQVIEQNKKQDTGNEAWNRS